MVLDSGLDVLDLVKLFPVRPIRPFDIALPQRRLGPLFSDLETPPENHPCSGRRLLAEVP
jgi:hypothetical protein